MALVLDLPGAQRDRLAGMGVVEQTALIAVDPRQVVAELALMVGDHLSEIGVLGLLAERLDEGRPHGVEELAQAVAMDAAAAGAIDGLVEDANDDVLGGGTFFLERTRPGQAAGLLRCPLERDEQRVADAGEVRLLAVAGERDVGRGDVDPEHVVLATDVEAVAEPGTEDRVAEPLLAVAAEVHLGSDGRAVDVHGDRRRGGRFGPDLQDERDSGSELAALRRDTELPVQVRMDAVAVERPDAAEALGLDGRRCVAGDCQEPVSLIARE